MTRALSDEELSEIERRVVNAFRVAPPPWTPLLETRYGTGGASAVQFGGDHDMDNEMYLDVHLGPDRLVSPDSRLDVIVDFLGNAPHDVMALIREVRRLRAAA
jgi:hypothetical protein